MPMSNKDNPVAEQPSPAKKVKPAKAEAIKVEAAKAPEEPEPAPELVKASTSGSADVQNLLARREIAMSNGDDTHVAALDAELAALGYKA